MDQKTVDWLLRGDPAIRWQTQRDLLDASVSVQHAERARIGQTGWGRQLLDEQRDDGRWTVERGPKGYRGLYVPKWTSTTYSLVLLRRFGLEPGHPAALRGCEALIDGSQWFDDGSIGPWASAKTDVCVCAMVLAILEWFDHQATDRRAGLVEFLLDNQKEDGGWNCRSHSAVSSFHTTISTLEALQVRRTHSPDAAIDAAMARGREYLLKRKLFRSLSTGAVVRDDFTRFSFPPRWYYDVMRSLDHLQDSGAEHDARCSEAIELVKKKQRKDGRWALQNRRSGETFFELEKPGKPSRWNTLRALRILRWWER